MKQYFFLAMSYQLFLPVKFFAEKERSGFNWGANLPLAFSILPNDRPAKSIRYWQSTS
jgi:hypothetical protein